LPQKKRRGERERKTYSYLVERRTSLGPLTLLGGRAPFSGGKKTRRREARRAGTRHGTFWGESQKLSLRPPNDGEDAGVGGAILESQKRRTWFR